MNYLDFDRACAEVEGFREAAQAAGDYEVAPDRLEDCDRGIIVSALMAPAHTWDGKDLYPDLQSKAAVLLYALAKSQACNVGNKRIAGILLQAFLRMNGHRLATTNAELVDRIQRASASEPDARLAVTDELKKWLTGAVVPEG